MLGRERLRVLPVAAGQRGVGKTTLLIGIACAAAAAGQRVAVLDPSGGELAAALSLTWRWELLHLLGGEREYGEVALAGPAGIGIVPAAKGVAALLAAGRGGEALFDGFARLTERLDLVLVNVPAKDPGACALLPQDAELLVVTRPSREAVTATYSHLKVLARRFGRHRLRLFVNRAPDAQARGLHEHMALVARRFLGTELAYGGSFDDEAMLRAGGPGAAAHCAHAFDALAQQLADWRLAEYGASRGAAAR
jgi:MinD-like ATPase involved in chromosome partitioning or flagellar assembly